MLVKPMLMTPWHEPFDSSQYIFEPMLDGQRLMLTFLSGKAQLFTRHHNEVTGRYPELLRVPLKKPVDVIFDGEAVYQHPETGKTDFQTLMQRFKMTRAPQVRDGMKQYPVQYYIFDILYADGNDVRSLPLSQRKLLIKELLEDNRHIHAMPYLEQNGVNLYDRINRYGLEGMACKRMDSAYIEGQSESWLKIKSVHETSVHKSA